MKISTILFFATIIMTTTKSYSCPIGWASVPKLDSAQEFCIETQKTMQVKAHEAHLICEEKDAKVCSTEQWTNACQSGVISSQGWEWSVSLDQYTSIIGNNDCTDLGFGELAPVANLRCCK
jgi:hypothetical protein